MKAYDNHDSRIRYVHLTMERPDLDSIPHAALPDGYRFVYYRPGDRDRWIDIELSAKELTSHEQGVEVWQKYYGNVEHLMDQRMLFIENAQGEKVATATAYPLDVPGLGQVHWVAVRRDHQGRGLARPLISKVLERMKELGCSRAMLTTQTTTWVACKLYLDYGFRPSAETVPKELEGWRILRTLTDHPALQEFESAGQIEYGPYTVRRFCTGDAEEVSALITHTLRTSNSKDYSEEYIENDVKAFTPEGVIERAGWTHFYVVCDHEVIVGCGAIGSYWGKKDESSLFNIFVLPAYQGRGVGRKIIETLEQDEFFLRAKRIEIPASITACAFYRKMGYNYKNGVDTVDEEQLYRLEKFR